MTEKELKHFRSQLQSVNDRISDLMVQRTALQSRIAEHYSQFKCGDAIQWGNGKRRGRVMQIVCGISLTSPKWKVAVLRKDGSEGRKTTVYSWDTPELMPAGGTT